MKNKIQGKISLEHMKQREKYLDHQLMQAVELLKEIQPLDGEILYGRISWERGILFDEDYKKYFEMDTEKVKELEEQPCYVFKYDGKVFSIIM